MSLLKREKEKDLSCEERPSGQLFCKMQAPKARINIYIFLSPLQRLERLITKNAHSCSSLRQLKRLLGVQAFNKCISLLAFLFTQREQASGLPDTVFHLGLALSN